MSYCRSSEKDSDVYVIGTRDSLECFGAGGEMERQLPVHAKRLMPSWTTGTTFDGRSEIVRLDEEIGHVSHTSFTTNSRRAMIDHLKVHRAMGHKVPKRALKRLREEIKTVGDRYA